jgi:predicted helicase
MSALPKKKSRIDKLVEDYWRIDGHRIDEKNLKSLKDDYVKFIRFCQWIIDENEEGVVGFITNHSYLDNPTFRGMRKSLMNSFDEIYILDLNGDAMRKNYQQNENEREGKDKNIFDIRQGVAISFFIKRSCRRPVQTYAFGDQERLIALWAGGAAPPGPPKIFYKEVKGAREKKLTCLSHNDITTIQWEEITPSWKFYSFKPSKQPTQNPTHKQDTYADFIRITDIFPIHSVGIVTARDQLCIQDNAEAVYKTINEFSTITESEARVKFNLGNDSRDWRIKEAQKDIIESGTDRGKIVPILYRPFDTRYTYYTGNSRGFICMPRPGVMKHLLKKNIGLITVRQSVEGNFTHCFAAETLVESRVCTSNRGICHVFPLYLYEADTVIPNISPGFIDMLRKEKGFTIAPAPQQLFNYVYAVLSSNVYRKQYEGYLKIDFPALPIPCDFRLFIEMAKLGERLVALHLMNSVELNDTTARFEGKGSNRVEMIEYSAGNGKPGMVYINKEQYFSGVQEEEWDYILNGYQVMDKWLRLRRGKTLSVKEITHFIRVVRIIRLTIQYQKLIDEKYPMIEQTIVSNK